MRDLLLTAFAGALTGGFVVWVFFRQRRKTLTRKALRLTRVLFGLLVGCALLWVFTSYAIAIYSTVVLGQVYTMAELAEPAITSLLATVGLKVLENIFEHNDSALFGHSNGKEQMHDQSDQYY